MQNFGEPDSLDPHGREQRSLALLRCAGEVLFEVDGQGRWLYLNDAWSALTGYSATESLGRPAEAFLLPEDRERLRSLLSGEGSNLPEELRWIAAGGDVVWTEIRLADASASADGSPSRLGALTPLSERRRLEQQVERLMFFDELTGLPNRQQALEYLKTLLHRQAGADRQVTVMLIDLDRFRDVNDSFGHRLGDGIIQAVAARLTEAAGDRLHLSRFGGDEFLAIHVADHSNAATLDLAGELLHSLDAPFNVDGHTLFLTATIGIALYPEDGLLGEDLVRRAGVAVRSAKGQGRSRAQFFRIETDRWLLDLKVTEDQIRRALEQGELVLHYQPQVDIASGRVQELEALIRWHHPERGLLSPSHFLPHANVTGLIRRIGEWALRTACSQLMVWRAKGLTDLRVAVNLSDTEFRDGDILAFVGAALDATGLPPCQLELELAETTIIKGREAYVADSLRELRAMGVTIALDDFGIGYSSLLYLVRLPVDKLKIDRSFIDEVDSSPVQAAIVRNTIRLARELGLLVVAEGVERPEQVEFLRSADCLLAQGFYYHKGLPPEEAWRVLARERGLS